VISSSQLRPGSRTESSRVRDRAVYGGGALGGSGSGHGDHDAPDGYRHRSRRSEDAYDYSSGGSTPRAAVEAAVADRGRGASAAGGGVHQGDAAPRHRRSGSDPAAAAARKAAAERFRAEREAELARHADVASGGLGSIGSMPTAAAAPQRPRPPPPSYEAATRAAEPAAAVPRADADAPRRPPAPARRAQPAAQVRRVGGCCEQRLHVDTVVGHRRMRVL